jgi:hypothetical protein
MRKNPAEWQWQQINQTGGRRQGCIDAMKGGNSRSGG